METTRPSNRSSSNIDRRKSPIMIEERGWLEQLDIFISKQGQWLRSQRRVYPPGDTALSASRIWLEYKDTNRLARDL
jgi:hypothetical protein